MGFLDERPQAKGVAMIDPAAVLHFNRNTLLAHSQNEIDLGLGTALGKVRDVETNHRTEEITDDALGDVPGEIGQMRRKREARWVERNDIL